MKLPITQCAILAAVLICVAACAARADDYSVARYRLYGHELRAFMKSKAPADAALRAQIAHAPSHLRSALGALSDHDLDLDIATAPFPTTGNAYVAYQKLNALHKKFAMPFYADVMSASYRYTPDELQKAKDALAANPAYFAALDSAVRLPYYQAPAPFDFGGYGRLREASRLLKSRAFLEAHDGFPDQALASSNEIFLLGSQISHESPVIGSLVAYAIYSIGYASTTTTLVDNDRSVDVALEVDRMLCSSPALPAPAASYFKWETAYYVSLMTEDRTGRQGELSRMFGAGPDSIPREGLTPVESPGLPAGASPMAAQALTARRLKEIPKATPSRNLRRALSSRELRVWNELHEQAEADYFRDLKRIENFEALSDRARLSALSGLQKDESASGAKIDSISGAGDFAMMSSETCIAGMFGYIYKSYTNIRTQRALHIGMARALEQRLPDGSFPDALANAPVDPWSLTGLRYRRTEKGFVVYSVGPTGKYDGADRGDRASSMCRMEYPIATKPHPD